MKEVDVRFANRHDVLDRYWGHLSGGGLIIDQADLDVGQPVSLHVHIDDTRHDYELAGRVRAHRAGQSVIAFDPGDSQGRLLTAAISDSPVSLDAQLIDIDRGGDVAVRIYSLSEAGCTLRVPAAAQQRYEVGSGVVVIAPEFRVEGTVLWAEGAERCVVFSDDEDSPAIDAVRSWMIANP